MKTMKTGIGLLLLALLTTGCSSAYYQSEGYAGDDLYGIHNKTKIAQREKGQGRGRKSRSGGTPRQMGGPHGAGAGRRRRKPLLRLERLRRSGGGRLRKRLRTTAAGLRIAHLQDAVELLEPPLQRNVQLPDGLRSGLLQHHRHGRRSVGRTQIHHFDVRHVGTGHRLRGGVYGRHLRQLVQQLGLRLALLRLGYGPYWGWGGWYNPWWNHSYWYGGYYPYWGHPHWGHPHYYRPRPNYRLNNNGSIPRNYRSYGTPSRNGSYRNYGTSGGADRAAEATTATATTAAASTTTAAAAATTAAMSTAATGTRTTITATTNARTATAATAPTATIRAVRSSAARAAEAAAEATTAGAVRVAEAEAAPRRAAAADSGALNVQPS